MRLRIGAWRAWTGMVLAVLMCAAASAENVRVEKGTLRLVTYLWSDDPNPVFAAYEKSIYYPYTRQDNISGAKEEREYRAIFLENEYLKVTCLPELGGRIHSVLDKTTGEEMFHKNDEIKPAPIAMRGAWISGGIEWNAGPQGHTVTAVSPVDATAIENPDGSATLVVGNTEKISRTRWTVRLTLHPGKAYLDETICIQNPTDGAHPYYFWNCTAFPCLEGTRFVYPMTLGCDHAGTKFFSWPIDEGKDLSLLRNYDTMSSIFAYECGFDFFGAYDAVRNRGIVSYANHFELKGKKAWTWGKDDFGTVSQMALSDAGPVNAQYIEVQSGPLLTQAEYGMLDSHQARTWREFWYPVHGLGAGFEYATRDIAIQTVRRGGALEVTAIATGAFPNAYCTFQKDGTELLRQSVDLAPNAPDSVVLPNAPESGVYVGFYAADGTALGSYEAPLNVPEVKPPDLAAKPARADGAATPDELYEKAFLADRQSNAAEARRGYESVLEADPGHVAALCGLATLDIEAGAFPDGEARARKALDRDPDCGRAWRLLGVAQLEQNNTTDAIASGYKAAATLDDNVAAYCLVGRAHMRLHAYGDAIAAFARALSESNGDARARDLWMAARYAAGERAPLETELQTLTQRDDPTDFIAHALLALIEDQNSFAKAVRASGGETEFIALDVASFFADLGRPLEAAQLLESMLEDGCSPLYVYSLIYYLEEQADGPRLEDLVARARQSASARQFPAGAHNLPILQRTVERWPEEPKAWLLLGDLLAGLGRTKEATDAWHKAVALDPRSSEAWRSLALDAKVKDNDLAEAERCYRAALDAAPEDPLVRYELASLLELRGQRPDAITLAESRPGTAPPRHYLVLWLAEAYIAESRYDDCLALLDTARCSNWEGQTRPHDVFVAALLGRGKARCEQRAYDQALADFERALTFPENLRVGARYRLTDAEVRYWLGRTLHALGRKDDAQRAWEIGAAEPGKADPPLPSILITDAQDEYKKRCATALELLAAQ